jgi:hypothetical protein
MLAKLHNILDRLGIFDPLDRACQESLRKNAHQGIKFSRLESPAYLRRATRIREVSTSR